MDELSGVARFVGRVRGRGVELWSDAGNLRYRAPKGSLAPEDLETLRTLKHRILALLEGDNHVRCDSAARSRSTTLAPLSFSQQTHWNWNQLRDRPATRQIASAVRLVGPLDLNAFRAALGDVVVRHDALRTRVVRRDGLLLQEVLERVEYGLAVGDLTTRASDQHARCVARCIDAAVLDPIALDRPPLWTAKLLKLNKDEHVLVIALEHLIADMFSMEVLLREWLDAYEQRRNGQPVRLPLIGIQFAEFAAEQAAGHRAWLDRHGRYWEEHLRGATRVRFPGISCIDHGCGAGWGAVPLRIELEIRQRLVNWCRCKQTSLVMGAFTAYVALVLRWCRVPEAVIAFQSDGRRDARVQNTIGYFASSLYLRSELRENDTFSSLLRRVVEEYCSAYEHADFSFFASQPAARGFTRNTVFNWIPARQAESGRALSCSAIPFVHPLLRRLDLDREPGIILQDRGEHIEGSVNFPLGRFPMPLMEEFARHYLEFLRALASPADVCIRDIPLG